MLVMQQVHGASDSNRGREEEVRDLKSCKVGQKPPKPLTKKKRSKQVTGGKVVLGVCCATPNQNPSCEFYPSEPTC